MLHFYIKQRFINLEIGQIINFRNTNEIFKACHFKAGTNRINAFGINMLQGR